MEASSRPLYLVCTRKEVCNWLNRNLNRRHTTVPKGDERNHDMISVDTELTNYWHAPTIPAFHPSYHHMIEVVQTLSFGAHPKLTSMKYNHTLMPIWWCLWNELLEQTCNTLIISKVQTCLPGSEKSESNSVWFASPSRPLVSTYSNK